MDMKFDKDSDDNPLLKMDGANGYEKELDGFLKESIGGYRGMIYEPKELDCIAKWSDRKLKDNEE